MELFENFPLIIGKCEDSIRNIKVTKYATANNVYWAIPPIRQSENSSNALVMLGIRDGDSEAISKIKTTFLSLKSYGTSAYGSKNIDFDTFYNYVIGVNDTGLQTIYDSNGNIVELKELSGFIFFRDVLGEKVSFIML
ncbi:hypothetical protein CRE_12873 [Caenorhabditis remanei]|uniref:Uncharacterized protein n=1 Tax=Caenorhabditis remanei TaxID=31234 RepID=E3MQQ8_CAERE|nr:hypothetical protein CRE_12873 [Caenorhabditis remanei]